MIADYGLRDLLQVMGFCDSLRLIGEDYLNSGVSAMCDLEKPIKSTLELRNKCSNVCVL